MITVPFNIQHKMLGLGGVAVSTEHGLKRDVSWLQRYVKSSVLLPQLPVDRTIKVTGDSVFEKAARLFRVSIQDAYLGESHQRALHFGWALDGDIWVPHAWVVRREFTQRFDPQMGVNLPVARDLDILEPTDTEFSGYCGFEISSLHLGVILKHYNA